ncbi:MAG: PaaI family thioesterase [Deltaproteobacteria bacterium]|nr:PaaI family thioesterase [Deltaproteobacteria bacterium]
MSDAHEHHDHLDPYTFGRDQTCFGCGPHNDVGLRLRFKREGDTVTTRFTLATGYDGPPGILHGGLQAMVADELAGWTLVGLRGRIGLTTSMNVRYIRSLYLGREVLGTGKILTEGENTATLRVTLSQDGKAGCMAKVSFAMADADKMEGILENGLPPGWRRFFSPE